MEARRTQSNSKARAGSAEASDGEAAEDRARLRQLQQSKLSFVRDLRRREARPAAAPHERMRSLIEKSELLANFLLTKHGLHRGKPAKHSASKSHVMKDAEEDGAAEFVNLTSQPSLLVGGQLKNYQLVGLNWLVSLHEIGMNGILADEMGLGKTIQVIAFLAYLSEYKKVNGPHLVVCPNTVLLNWQKEFRKWLPSLRVIKLFPRKEFRFETFEKYIRTKKFDVLLTTYEGVNICKAELKKTRWRYVIVDEAHRLKNEESLLSRNLREFDTELKILLTGTPLQNNLRELWALLNFILPELFEDADLFEMSKPADKGAAETPEQLEKKHVELIQSMHRILRPFILKRSKETVDLKLPPKTEIHLYLGLTQLQLAMYKNILLKKPLTDDASATRNVLMQLRKCCNHPFLFPGVENEQSETRHADLVSASGKMIVLDKLLRKLKQQGDRQVLVFSQFTSMLSIIEDYLIGQQWDYCRIDGDTFIEQRERQIEEFSAENSGKFVFLLSTRAGGLGINLATADTVIIYDSDWNPQVDLQAMDRAHRIGQKQEVRIYRLVCENTVEEKMIERQKVKMKWDSLVILRGKSASKHALSKKEMAELINYGANRTFRAENGTFRDEDIDQLLAEGAKKTAALQTRIDEAFKSQSGLLDLNIESINIYEFDGNDYGRRQADDQAVRQAIDDEMQLKKLKKRGIVGPAPEPPKPQPVQLPEHHFFPSKARLEQLLSRAEGALSPEELAEKEALWKEGFVKWTKNDFQALLRAIEKYGREDLTLLSNAVKKTPAETEQYMATLFARIEELPDHEKILRNFEKGSRLRASKVTKEALVRRKCEGVSHFEDLAFEMLFYNKVRSKLLTILHDKFLVFGCYQFGLGNVKLIRQSLVNEPLFRFDFYVKSLRESVLSKRIASLLKMLQNEAEYHQSEKYQQLLERERLRGQRPEPRSRSRPSRATNRVRRSESKEPNSRPRSAVRKPRHSGLNKTRAKTPREDRKKEEKKRERKQSSDSELIGIGPVDASSENEPLHHAGPGHKQN